MRVSAQRVVSDAGEQGINTFVYIDNIKPWPADPTVLLDGEPGTLAFHSFINWSADFFRLSLGSISAFIRNLFSSTSLPR